jgi:hypothetical protein
MRTMSEFCRTRSKRICRPSGATSMIQMGDALILTPVDKMLTEITERMEAAIRGTGVIVEELMKETLVARAEIACEEFGDET